MFIDTSAIVAILADEPEAAAFLACIEAAQRRDTGPHVRLEATINLARILGLPVAVAQEMYDTFLAAAGISVVSIGDAVARLAVSGTNVGPSITTIFRVLGRGRTTARLQRLLA